MKSADKKFPKKYLIWGGMGLVILLLAILIPLSMPNGTERYTGIKRDAARGGVEFVSDFFNGLNSTGHFATIKTVVESVKVADNQDAFSCNSDFITQSVDSTKVFEVTVSFRTIFGISTGDFTAKMCASHEGDTPLLPVSS